MALFTQCRTLGLLLVGALTAYHAHLHSWVDLPGLPASTRLLGFDPAPPWLAPMLQAMPRRRLNDSEREVLRRDGAVFIKGAIPNEELMSYLLAVLGTTRNNPKNLWYHNGVLHTLMKHGPLAELSASATLPLPLLHGLGGTSSGHQEAMDVPSVAVWNAQLEPRPTKHERLEPLPFKPWYDLNYGNVLDQSVHEDTDAYVGTLHSAGHFVKPQASIFLALTPIPHGFELLAGSHVANQRHHCRRTGQQRDEFALCMNRLEADCRGVRWWDLEPGDAVFFYGSTFHWSVLQEKPRVALSVRYIPSDMMFTGVLLDHGTIPSYYPWKCRPLGGSPMFPIFHSDNGTVEEQPFPLWPLNADRSHAWSLLRGVATLLDPRCGSIVDY